MNEIFTKAVELASSLGIAATEVGDGVYLGREQRYLIVTMTSEPTFYGDDDPQTDRYSVSIDIYVPMWENYRTWLPGARIKMESLGFEDVTFDGQVYDTEDDKRHLMLNGIYDIYRVESESDKNDDKTQ